MKPTTVFYTFALPLLVGAAPEPEPEPIAAPEPQWQGLIPLIGGAFLLGALGVAEGARENSMRCACPNQQFRCDGTTCQCQNQAAIGCWVSKSGKCSVEIKNCPGPDGRGKGNPTPPNGEFPPCDARNANSCNTPGRSCKSLSQACSPREVCSGICIPGVTPAQPAQPKWGWGTSAPPKQTSPPRNPPPKQIQACNINGNDNAGIAVALPISGTPGCADPNAICAGWRKDQCPPGQFCVTDPRYQCRGEGCTGICAK